MRMIGLSDRQLEIITCEAETMAERTCQDFLDRVAAILQQVHSQIDDDDVSVAVRQALRELIHNSDVWKDWKQNSLPMRESGERLTATCCWPKFRIEAAAALVLVAGFDHEAPFFAAGLGALALLGSRRKRRTQAAA